eukprot:459761_1
MYAFAGQLLFLVIKICPEYRTPYVIQLLMVIVYKIKWFMQDRNSIQGPYIYNQQPQEHIQKIAKRIAKFCNNNYGRYMKRVVEFLDIYIVGALEENFVSDKTIFGKCQKNKTSVLFQGETPDNIISFYKAECMPEKLGRYFKILDEIKRSNVWPKTLRETYVELFNLNECYEGCNMEVAQPQDNIADQNEHTVDDDDDVGNYIVNSDDVLESIEYAKVMDAKTQEYDGETENTNQNFNLNVILNDNNNTNNNIDDNSDEDILEGLFGREAELKMDERIGSDDETNEEKEHETHYEMHSFDINHNTNCNNTQKRKKPPITDTTQQPKNKRRRLSHEAITETNCSN